MSSVKDLSAEQLLIHYAIAKREYKRVYAELKELEEEMDRRVSEQLENNRKPKRRDTNEVG